jgi:lipoyltransferase/lipoate-protein ligase
MKIFHSRSTNPFFNLAVEDWLLREYPVDEEVWFFYQNEPSIVLGRFQNPWLEADLSWLKSEGAHLVRRPSGGGCVWHDLGNVNFCRVSSQGPLIRDHALKFIQAKIFKHFDIDLEINARFDLVYRMADQTTRKVSGSAYKQTKDRTLHHGTLLISSDLLKLERSLHSPARLRSTKSIPSVRSMVKNLNELHPLLTPESWLDCLGMSEVIEADDSRFQEGLWSRPEWVMGETPHFEWSFEFEGESYYLESHKGKIVNLRVGEKSLSGDGVWLSGHGICTLLNDMSQMPAWSDFLGI